MKKIISLLISLVLLFSLSACDNKENKSTNGTESTSISVKTETANVSESAESISEETFDDEVYKKFMANYLDLSHYDVKMSDYGTLTFTLKKEFEREYRHNKDVRLLNDLTITVDGTIKLKLGDPVSKLLNNGWEFKYENPNNTINANLVTTNTILVTNWIKEFNIGFANSTDNELKYKATEISGFMFENYNYARFNNREINRSCVEYKIGDLNWNSNLKDILKVFGEPENLYVNTKNGNAEFIELSYNDYRYATYDFIVSADGCEILTCKIS